MLACPDPDAATCPEPSALDQLKARVRAIERASTRPARPQPCISPAPHASTGTATPAAHQASDIAGWTLGAGLAAFDLTASSLEIGAVHEIKPVRPDAGTDWPSAWSAARSFALALAGRRLKSLMPGGARSGPGPAPGQSRGPPRGGAEVLWCTSSGILSLPSFQACASMSLVLATLHEHSL